MFVISQQCFQLVIVQALDKPNIRLSNTKLKNSVNDFNIMYLMVRANHKLYVIDGFCRHGLAVVCEKSTLSYLV